MPSQHAPSMPSIAASTALTTMPTPGSVQAYALAEKADATRRTYRSDIEMFGAWCQARRNVEPLGASLDTVAAFLAGQASVGVKPFTLMRRMAAIGYAHRLAGLSTPAGHEVVRAVMRGIRRTAGTAPAQKAPAAADRIAAMLQAALADTLRGKRDRALLLLGFAGAFRRSEPVVLDVADLTFEPEGMRVMVRRSKAD